MFMEKGIFPDCLKTAKIIPIFKSGNVDKDLYRRISIMTNFSKFFEKVMHKCLSQFIKKIELLYSFHLAFERNTQQNTHSSI